MTRKVLDFTEKACGYDHVWSKTIRTVNFQLFLLQVTRRLPPLARVLSPPRHRPPQTRGQVLQWQPSWRARGVRSSMLYRPCWNRQPHRWTKATRPVHHWCQTTGKAQGFLRTDIPNGSVSLYSLFFILMPVQ